MSNLYNSLYEKLEPILGQAILIEGYGVYKMDATSIYLGHEFNGSLSVVGFDITIIFKLYESEGVVIPAIEATYDNLIAFDSKSRFTHFFDDWLEKGLIEKEEVVG